MATSSLPANESSDPLGEVLHLLELTGTLYCRAEMSAPWGVALPESEGLMMFQIVTSGRCWLSTGDREPLLLRAGSMTLLPRGSPHTIRSDPDVSAEPLADIPVEKVSECYELMRHGGGGDTTHVTCGVVRFDHAAARRLVELLPDVLHVDGWDDDAGDWIESTLRWIGREASVLRPGGETVITRLADILIIQAVRSWLDRAAEARTGWLAALRDRRIGRALASIHRAPGLDWTVSSLAGEAGMSRSAFATRFGEMLGEPVIAYLARWRMQTARALLADPTLSLSDIAERSGYRSEAAFSRAFKREYGAPPGSLRRSGARRVAPGAPP